MLEVDVDVAVVDDEGEEDGHEHKVVDNKIHLVMVVAVDEVPVEAEHHELILVLFFAVA